MKILIINSYGKAQTIETDVLPRKGDKIDMFFMPVPTVVNVLLFPSDETLKGLNVGIGAVDAIIFVE